MLGNSLMKLADSISKNILLPNWQFQCDHIGRFLKVLDNKCNLKSSPEKMVNYWAYFEKHDSLSKTDEVTFGATFGTIGQLYLLTSGHNVGNNLA